MGRVPGIGGSLTSSAQPLSLVVLFHMGPYQAKPPSISPEDPGRVSGLNESSRDLSGIQSRLS